MSSQSLISKGALHLCFAVSERASAIPLLSYYHGCFDNLLLFEIFYYCSLADYVIDMSHYNLLELLLAWLVIMLAGNLGAV